MSEGRLRDEQSRGERAAMLLRDPLIVETFSVLEEKYVGEWKDSPSAERRETLFQMYQALMMVRGHLTEVVETGNLAKLETDLQKNL